MKNEFLELIKMTSSSISFLDILLNYILIIVCSYVISVLYNRYSESAAYKDGFSKLFIYYSTAIFLIIVVIQSSLTLSLGLVGALSIIRFRTAIKEPEQLVYLLMLTGIAIGSAANQTGVVVLGAVIFSIIIYVKGQLINKFNSRDRRVDTATIVLEIDNLSIIQSIENIAEETELLSYSLQGKSVVLHFTNYSEKFEKSMLGYIKENNLTLLELSVSKKV